ncbi:MAG: hypothetical protein MI746_07280 [Pseudomonadales bacterium]|nr:hypothetical protein [Pseudomonadales bacterium]
MGEPIGELLLDVFGRTVMVRRSGESWEACYMGNEGKKRTAEDIQIPPTLAVDEIPNYIADLCHEWATPQHDEVRVID